MSNKIAPVYRKAFESIELPPEIPGPLWLQYGRSRSFLTPRGEQVVLLGDSEFSARVTLALGASPDGGELKTGDILRVDGLEIRPNPQGADELLPEIVAHSIEVVDHSEHLLGEATLVKAEKFSAMRRTAKVGDGAQSRPSGGNTGPVSGQGTGNSVAKKARGDDVIPIEAVTGFVNKWTIVARVSDKSPIRTFTSKRGNGDEGKLFNVSFVDETGEIRATAFTADVDKFYDLLQEGQVYRVSKLDVRSANKKFNSTGHDFELMFRRDSTVVPEFDSSAAEALPSVVFNFVPRLADLVNHQADTNCDVIGVIYTRGEVQQLTAKSTGRPYTKLDVELVDESGGKVRLTLWGELSESFEGQPGDVIAIKGARISDFDGRSLSALRTSKVVVNPVDEHRAQQLKGWYDADGRSRTFQSLRSAAESAGGADSNEQKRSFVKTVAQVFQERLGMSEETEYFTMRAHIVRVYKRNLMYASCPTEGCFKKVTEFGGSYRCEKCDRDIEQPVYRYILSAMVEDATLNETSMVLSMFDELGQTVIGKTADEVHELDEAQVDELLQSIEGDEYTFRIRAKQDVYQGNVRARFQAVSATATKQQTAKLAKVLLTEIGC